MVYFPANIPEEAEEVEFHYSNITFAPGREDRTKYIRLTCSGLPIADIHEQYADIAVRTESGTTVTEYVLWDSPWQSDDWSEEKDIYCSVTVDTAEDTVCYSIRIEI